MKKKLIKTNNIKARGPLARKLIKSIQIELKKKITNLSDIRTAREEAKKSSSSTASSGSLKEYDPLHGLYIDAQNKLSVIIESICQLPILNNLIDKYSENEEKYMPSYPPLSPVTTACFMCWASFDLQTSGKKNETLTTIVIDFCNAIKADKNLVHVFETMQESRMGIYKHEGRKGSLIKLKEIYTDEVFNVHVASSYLGIKGEIWLARLMPPIFGSLDYFVVFTTPYILSSGNTNQSTRVEWLSYIDRTLEKFQATNTNFTYIDFMKNGLYQSYWLEFITLSYINHTNEKIVLDGIPDIINSLPHGHIADSKYLKVLQ